MAEPGLTVLKIGGAVCREPSRRQAALDAVRRLAGARRVLVVPGGGALADEVRASQRARGFSDDMAHWLAILAMDQVARSIASELEGAQLIHLRNEVEAVHDAGKIPVLVLLRRLRNE